MNNYPEGNYSSSRSVMVKNATLAAFSLGGGVALLILKGISQIPFVGPIVGIGLLLAGIFRKKDKSAGENVSSLVMIGLGAASIASVIPILGGLSGALLTLSGIGLIAFGGWKLYEFYRAYKAKKNR